jgi:murein DD-endopeptidase MepM/ murein hydrolase activator NlpD
MRRSIFGVLGSIWLAAGSLGCVPKAAPRVSPEAELARALSGMIWPLPFEDPRFFTSTYGPRSGRHHDGVDVAAPAGTPFHAAADGIVVFSGSRRGYGHTIVLDHGRGVTTLYAHASALYVGVGERIARGQQIGAVGATGNARGTHVHFEIAWRGVPIDPLPLLPALGRR